MARRRKNRRRRGSVWRFAWRHRGFILVLLILGALWLSYAQAIAWSKAYTERIAALQEQLNKMDFSKHPEAYIAAQRSIEVERLEPVFMALLLLIPLSFLTVLIICIIKYSGRSSAEIGHRSMDYYSEIRTKRIERAQNSEQHRSQ